MLGRASPCVKAPCRQPCKQQNRTNIMEIFLKIIITILLLLAAIFLAPLFGIPTIVCSYMGYLLWKTSWD